jgi:hypothetical protein
MVDEAAVSLCPSNSRHPLTSSFTEELKAMHEELASMKAGRAKMERDLRKKLGTLYKR